MSAGARLTVILVVGKLYPEFLTAVLTLSLLSWIEVSASHTIVKLVTQYDTSTSTSIFVHSSQFIETEFIFDTIFWQIKNN